MANELINKELDLEPTISSDIVASPFGNIRRKCFNGEYWICGQDACHGKHLSRCKTDSSAQNHNR